MGHILELFGVCLYMHYPYRIFGVEDLSDLANQKLASLTETLVCKQLLKPNSIRLGNWEVHPLSKKQLQYAATDAYASWHLYQVLKDLPDAEVPSIAHSVKDEA